MTAPTTRETADHAELARIEALLREHIKVDASGLAPAVVSHFVFGFDTAASALLSEIAALRGEVASLEIRRDFFKHNMTQAERQRDELRKALERIADEAPYRSGYCQSDVEYGPALSADEMQAVARQALANQGADQ